MTFQDRVSAVAAPFRRSRIETLQVNVGKLCNQACRHCHVDAGPHRTEIMAQETADRILEWFAATSIPALDITGGAPELAPPFRGLVERAVELGRRVIVRHNLTIQEVDGYHDLPEFYRDHQVRVVASLPCYLEENVDQQRGKGAYRGSIHGLQRLNAVGYGRPDTELVLDLVYNPLGPSLPPCQESLRTGYAEHLFQHYGIVFNDLLTITNVPIHRFRHQLEREGRLVEYQVLLEENFNPATVAGLMCCTQLSVDWLGYSYDCDFNQMLGMRIANGRAKPLWECSPDELCAGEILTGSHCYACTAGAGSSCGGALA